MVKTCLRCHATAEPVSAVKGSFIAELLVWILSLLAVPFFSILILGLPIAFTLVRFFSRSTVCKSCGSSELVPVDSPAAQKLRGPRGPEW